MSHAYGIRGTPDASTTTPLDDASASCDAEEGISRGGVFVVYSVIANKAKSLWKGGPFGKVAAVLLIVIAASSIALLRMGMKKAATGAIVGCGLDDAATDALAQTMMQEVKANYGASVAVRKGESRVAFAEPQFDIDYVSMSNPCDSFFGIRVPIGKDSMLPSKQMLEALEDREIGGKYDRGINSSFQYDEDAKTFSLSFLVPVLQARSRGLVSVIEDKRTYGASWRQGWFEEVARIAMGEAPAPKEHVWRPGKDPDSVLRGVDTFLKDAGQPGIYP